MFFLLFSDSRRWGLSVVCKWKQVFLRAYHLQQNWLLSRYHIAPILRGHREKVLAIATNGEIFMVAYEYDLTFY